jgi:2-methylcitrate dehydratase PrpD
VALEARDGGFFAAFAPDRPEPEWGEVLAGVGSDYWLPEVAFKPYPCCRTAHTAIDAALALKEEGLNVDDVESVTVHTYRVAVDQCGFNDPVNEVQAAFSTPYLIACALTDGWVNTSHFTTESVRNPAIRDLQSRIRVLHDPAMDRGFPELWPSRVAVVTKAGVTLEREVAIALGDPMVPMSEAQQARKMRAGVEPLLGANGAAALVEAMRQLPNQGASDPLWEALEATRPDASDLSVSGSRPSNS